MAISEKANGKQPARPFGSDLEDGDSDDYLEDADDTPVTSTTTKELLNGPFMHLRTVKEFGRNFPGRARDFSMELPGKAKEFGKGFPDTARDKAKHIFYSVKSSASTIYQTKFTRRRVRKIGPFLLLGLVSLLACQWFIPFLSFPVGFFASLNIPRFRLRIPVPDDLQRKWGPYTPWYSVQPYPAPPSHCTITQVNILQRHSARYPTHGAAEGMIAALEKLQLAPESQHASLKFLKEYKYDLGTDVLVPFGIAHANYSGSEAYHRYQHLVTWDNIPFVRAAEKQRVVNSAKGWAAGFAKASKGKYIPRVNVVIDRELNNTLADTQCPSAGNSKAQTDTWISIFATPIAERLNDLAPGANLTANDVYNLMLFCPFESTAKVAKSPFCSPKLFSPEEFSQLSYTFDLDKFYFTGYGQPLGRVQGVGYVNELLARLTGKPVQDNTQTNHTLDSSPITFPLDRNVYIDFSSDNEMIAIYSALGLFRQDRELNPAHPTKGRTWHVNEMVPFGSRMVTELLTCKQTKVRKSKKKDKKTYVRILVNDAVQPMEFCDADVKNGLCELKKFVMSQEYARNDGEGDWEKCFADA